MDDTYFKYGYNPPVPHWLTQAEATHLRWEDIQPPDSDTQDTPQSIKDWKQYVQTMRDIIDQKWAMTLEREDHLNEREDAHNIARREAAAERAELDAMRSNLEKQFMVVNIRQSELNTLAKRLDPIAERIDEHHARSQRGVIILIDDKRFITTAATLSQYSRWFSAILSKKDLYNESEDVELRLDRSADSFEKVLAFMRTGIVDYGSLTKAQRIRLRQDADFYEIDVLGAMLDKHEAAGVVNGRNSPDVYGDPKRSASSSSTSGWLNGARLVRKSSSDLSSTATRHKNRSISRSGSLEKRRKKPPRRNSMITRQYSSADIDVQ